MREGWIEMKLMEIGVTQTGTTPKTSERENYGNFVPFIKPADMDYVNDGEIKYDNDGLSEIGFKKGRRMEKDSVMMVCIGATIGKVGLTNRTVSCNQQINVLTVDKAYEPKFFYYAMTTKEFQDKVLAEGQGAQATLPIINKTKWENLTLGFPKSKAEQQRIVAILDEAFAAIAKAKANAEQNLQNAKELFESYLQGVFENKGEGWKEKILGEIGKPFMCKRIFKEETTATGDIPFYKIGTFGKQPDAFISNKIYTEYRKKFSFPKKGDILISASGTIGRRVKYNGKPAYFQDSNIVWIDNDERQVLNDYLYHFYGACKWNSTQGATISRLYNDNLKQIKISFPTLIDHQQTIVRQLNDLQAQTQKSQTIYQQKIDSLEKLKKSILQKAFAGELTTEKEALS